MGYRTGRQPNVDSAEYHTNQESDCLQARKLEAEVNRQRKCDLIFATHSEANGGGIGNKSQRTNNDSDRRLQSAKEF